MVVEGVRIVSTGSTLFSFSLAKAALFVFSKDPLELAKDHGNGPKG